MAQARACLARILAPAIIAAAAFSGAQAADLSPAISIGGGFTIAIVEHATFVLERNGTTILVDPGNRGDWSGLDPDLILVTHDHADHYDPSVAGSAVTPWTLAHGQSVRAGQVTVTAFPMPASRLHGLGNSYLVEAGGFRIWIAGDVISVPHGIGRVDVAFIPLRPPFTWGIGEAAVAMNALRPGAVYPYHYHRGDDPNRLQALVSSSVHVLNWYP